MPEAERNGIIRGYEVHDSEGDTMTLVNGSDVFYVRVLLSPYVIYSLSLRAFTDVGPSPPSTVYIYAPALRRQYTYTVYLSLLCVCARCNNHNNDIRFCLLIGIFIAVFNSYIFR